MASFNDYLKGNKSNSSDNGKAMELLRQVASKYEGASEGEIISAIIKEAEKNRAQGKLTNDDLDSFSGTIKPMLTQEQAKKLDKIIERLKKR